MAFISAITDKTVMGNQRVHKGYFNSSSAAGGDIDTGLRTCQHIDLTCKGSAVALNAPSVNEDLPVAGGALTIVVDSGQEGYWRAEGL